jgi:hypothetical protein
MDKKCRHGIIVNKLKCILCDKNAKNYCKCNNNGTCELCKVFKPICKDINDCLYKICIENKYDTNMLKVI